MNNATKFKEMEYKERCEPYQLATGVYKDYKYYVLSLGSHPCCYVDLGTDKELYEILANNSILRVHGGATYNSHTLKTVEDKGLYIGWDYSHYKDYVYGDYFYTTEQDKKYTTKELISDCQKAIDDITQIKKSLEKSWRSNLADVKTHISKLKDDCKSETEKTLCGEILMRYVRELFDVY